MKLWKVHIKDYYFGSYCYDLFVLADTESNMRKQVSNYPAYKRSEDSQIVSYEEILMEGENRIL